MPNEMMDRQRQCRALISWTGLLFVLLVSLMLRVLYAQISAFSYDEGHWLMFGILAAQGHTPYTETFVGIPPLALLTIQSGATLFGSALSVRYPMLLYSLIGVGTIYWMTSRQADARPALAGLLAAMFLSFTPGYFFASTSIMAEVPALSFALLSLALVEGYRSRSSYLWLFLSGVAFAFSLALKIFIVFLPLIIGLQLLMIVVFDDRLSLRQRSAYVKFIRMGTAWVGGVIVVLALFLLLYDPAAMVRQVGLFRLVLRDAAVAAGEGIQYNISILAEEIGQYVPLMAGALSGLWLGGQRGLQKRWIWLIWFVVASLFILFHVPLRPRHAVMLLPPLAALSGLAVADLAARISFRLRRPAAWPAGLVSILLGGWVLFEPVHALTSPPPEHSFDDRHEERLSAVTYIRQTTAPEACIVVDDQRFALLAGRLVPPYLSETSAARLSVGWLTTQQIIETADQYDCPAFIIRSDRFDIYAPGLREAATSLYSLQLEFSHPEKSDKTVVYAVKMNTHQAPSHVIDRSLGGQVILNGVDVTPSPWRAGQPVSISTYWQAQRKMDRDYKIFVHIKDAQGQVVANFDHYPFESSPKYLIFHTALNPKYLEGQVVENFAGYPAAGLIPTRLWIPGNTLKETITVNCPDTLPAGLYTMEMGMYDEATMQNLIAQDSSTPGDQGGGIAIPVQVVR